MDNVVKSNIFNIKLATDVQPKMSIDNYSKFVKWGKNNDYPERLLFWRNNQPEHGAIITGKARYIAGLSITTEVETPQIKSFLDKANPFESWHSVIEKLADDEVTSGGYFRQIITNILGVPVHTFHLSFAKCRISDCEKYVLYSECGKWRSPSDYITIPVWNGKGVGTFVEVYKRYQTSLTKLDAIYPRPEYQSCTLDIDTDVRVTTFFNNLVKNNFNPGAIVTIRNGETDVEKKRKQAEDIKGNHSGEDEVANAVVIFAPKDAATTEVITLNGNDLDKQYQEVGKRNQQKILSGHGVNGILFKIKTEGQLGGRTEIVENHELFINEYVKIKQIVYKRLLNESFRLMYGQDVEFEFEQVRPIGLEMPLDNQNVINAIGQEAFKNYVIEKFGIKLPKVLDANGQEIQTNVSVNDNMKGLSAAENADVLRIVRDFQKGRSGMTEAMAISRIASYGVTEEEAKKWLGIQTVKQSAKVDFFALFEKYSHEINLDDEIIDIQEVKFSSMSEALQFEKVRFATVEITTTLKNSILNEFKGNPNADKNKIAKKYDLSEEGLNKVIRVLRTDGLLTKDLTPTEKALNKKTEPTESNEIYTEYVYTKRPDVPGEVVMATTRDFCRNMVALTKTKALSFEAIFSMTNELGENVWDYRGGFYTNPKTGETTPWCRHAWSAVTKIRRRK